MLVLCFYTTSLNLEEQNYSWIYKWCGANLNFSCFFSNSSKSLSLNLTGRIIQNGLYYVVNVINSFITSEPKLKVYYLFVKNITLQDFFSLLFFFKKKRVKKDKTASLCLNYYASGTWFRLTIDVFKTKTATVFKSYKINSTNLI